MKNTFILLFLFSFLTSAYSQNFTNWITGDTADVTTNNYQAGIVLAGGSTDNDDAMKWMLQRAAGGDVVVIRASGSNGYNDYFFSELGVTVNSVESIRFNNASAAIDPYVIQQIKNAEALFIAGGDQYNYYEYWKDTPIEDAINFLINNKKVTVGGTSAGMAILGNAYYTPPGGSASSEEALSNPFHPDVDIVGYGDFINNTYLPAVITDTHFDQRERAGRLLVFMGRLAKAENFRSFGIACNEFTAVCIDENSTAHVFGEYPEFDDFAYFLETNCQEEFLPEAMEEGVPYTWDRNGAAVKVYRVPGTIEGSNNFDVEEWKPGSGGEWFNWFAKAGVLHQEDSAEEGCGLIISSAYEPVHNKWDIKISPSLVKIFFTIETSNSVNEKKEIRIVDFMGRVIFEDVFLKNIIEINMAGYPDGMYFVNIKEGRLTAIKTIIKFGK